MGDAMQDSPAASRFTFNAYDLFSNFLPGAVLIIGLALPFLPSDSVLPDLNLVEILSAIIISFGAGIVTQSIGSVISQYKLTCAWLPYDERTRPFNKKMENMFGEDDPELDCSNIDWCAKELCVEVFNLEEDQDPDTEHIFKSLLAYLESTNFERGLRIQALHLASRGLYVTCLLLFLYYVTFAIGLVAPLEIFNYNGSFTPLHLAALSGGMIPIILILFTRSRHFEEDVVVYILSEFYISQCDWENVDVPPLDRGDDSQSADS